MPRLGELLVAAGLLTPEQVEQALRAQVLWGGRLGTNLVELHYLELDPLSAMLGRHTSRKNSVLAKMTSSTTGKTATKNMAAGVRRKTFCSYWNWRRVRAATLI